MEPTPTSVHNNRTFNYTETTCNIDLMNSIFFKHYGDRKKTFKISKV